MQLLEIERRKNTEASTWVEQNGGFENCLERIIRVAAEIENEAIDEPDGHHRHSGWNKVVHNLREAFYASIRHGINPK